MSDLIKRQDAIKAIEVLPNCYNGFSDTYDKAYIIGTLEELPSADPHLINIEAYAHDMGVSLEQAEKELQVYRWIPCSERSPEDGRYLCTYANEEGICVDFGRFSKGEWFVKPIAWMPLPEPYKEDDR